MILLLPPPTVTLDVRATSLAKALPIIGRAFGTPMRASPAIGDEIAIAVLRGASLDGFKARLAETFAGEWTADRDGTLVFGPSAKLRREEARASADRRDRALARGAAAFRAALAANAPMTAEGLARAQAANPKGPDGEGRRLVDGLNAGAAATLTFEPPERRFVERLLGAMRPEDFGAVGSRIVFASRPNAMQRAFPGDIAAALTSLESERRAWVSVTNDTTPVGAPVALLTLAVEHDEGEVRGSLTAYDAGAHPLFARDVAVDAETGEVSDYAVDLSGETVGAVGVSEPPPPPGPKVPLTFSPETLAFIRTMGAGGSYYPPGKPRPALTDYAPFLDPLARDPLSYAASDVARSLAEATNRSVLVRAEDGLIACGELTADPRPVTAEEALLTRRVDLSHEGWLTARPDDPYASGLKVFPREALGKGLRMARAAPSYPVETQVALAGLVPEAPGRWVPLAPMLARLARVGNSPLPYDLRGLRLLAALDPGGLGPPREIAFGAMSPPARARAEAIVFGPGPLAVETLAGPPATRAEHEPTLLLPNGLPPRGTLTIATTDEPALLVRGVTYPSERVVLPEGLADLVFRAAAGGVNAERYDTDAMTLVSRRTLAMTFALTPRHVGRRTILSTTPTETRVGLGTLPPETKARYDRAYRALAARPKGESERGYGAPPP